MKCRVLGVLILMLSLTGCGEWVFRDYLRQGQERYDAGDYAGAYDKWYVLAKQGSAEAQANLGDLYFNEAIFSGEVDLCGALEFYGMAALQQSARGQFGLGNLYSNLSSGTTGLVIADSSTLIGEVLGDAFSSGPLHRALYFHGNIANFREIDIDPFEFCAKEGGKYSLEIFKINNEKKIDSSLKAALYWYSLAAEQGVAPAMLRMALLHLDEYWRARKNKSELDYWLELAARHGQTEAMMLQDMLLDGDAASYWRDMAVAHGSMHAMYVLGETADYEGDGAKALYWYRLALEQELENYVRLYKDVSVDKIQMKIGDHYFYGNGVEKDHAQALYWYRLSAENGNSDAAFNLGWLYSQGIGVAQDDAQALHWYQLAVKDDGRSVAGVVLAAMCAAGGIDRLKEMALFWHVVHEFSRLFEGEDPLLMESQVELDAKTKDALSIGRESFGRYYPSEIIGYLIKHKGIPREELIKLAYDAESHLSTEYWRGNCFEKDIEMAIWLAADSSEHSKSQSLLGMFYQEGIWVKQDMEKAQKWYIRAASQGDEFAQNRLELLYRYTR